MAVGQHRLHALFDDHDIVFGIDAAKIDLDVGTEQLSEFDGNEVRDLFAPR
jgi:hypothetical protein